MAEFYVYELRDPRSEMPFYVGKGKGDRIDAHEREARKGVSSPKCERIKEIWTAGLQVEKEKIDFYETAKEAFAAESKRIAEIGRDNLTNFGPISESVERRYYHVARFISLWLRIFHGKFPKPDPVARPFASAIYDAIARRDYKPFIREQLKKVGPENLKQALKPFGVDLQYGG